MQSPYEDILSSEEFVAVAAEEDLEAARRHTNTQSALKSESKATQNKMLRKLGDIRKARKDAEDAAAPKAKPKRGGRGGARGGGRGRGAAEPKLPRDPAPLPVDDALFTEPFVMSLLPEACDSRVSKDLFNGRYRVWFRLTGPPKTKWRNKSYSWGCRSCRDCVIACLRYVWTWAEAEIDCECLIADLFSAAGPDFDEGG